MSEKSEPSIQTNSPQAPEYKKCCASKVGVIPTVVNELKGAVKEYHTAGDGLLKPLHISTPSGAVDPLIVEPLSTSPHSIAIAVSHSLFSGGQRPSSDQFLV